MQSEREVPDSKGKNADKEEKKRQIDERKELEDLIKSQEDSLMSLTDEANQLIPTKDVIRFDNEKASLVSLGESASIVDANAKFFLTPEIIQTEGYIQEKMKADVMLLSDILRQGKISDYTIVKMLEIIDEGNMHPRAFEVLSSLQRTKLDITKMTSQYINSMENGYKNLKEDYKTKRNEEAIEVEYIEQGGKGPQDLTTRGTRTIIQQMRQMIDEPENEIEE